MKNIAIYGAKSIALGAYRAIRALYPEYSVKNFLVSKKIGNPDTLAGLPVIELSDFSDKEAEIIIATPETLHSEISKYLDVNGFCHYICLDSKKEAALMERYYSKMGMFPSLHSFNEGETAATAVAYTVKFYKDQPLHRPYAPPAWTIPLQVGADLTDQRICTLTDNTGDHISSKNPNYCELTAFYYIWKNELQKCCDEDYIGIFHYRRFLDISEADLYRLSENDIDVVLPYPMLHEPDICEHHTRYVKEPDWQTMRTAIQEVQPEYAADFDRIFGQEHMYNYNMLLAKKKVLEEYCAWLFSITERIEELSTPKESQRADRYIAYMGESLLTLYFMHKQNRLKIAHTGRIMLT